MNHGFATVVDLFAQVRDVQLHDIGPAAEVVTPDAVITPAGIARGKEGIRQLFVKLLDDIPNALWDLKTQIFEGDILFLEWTANSAVSRVDDGVDTFVFRDGTIWAHTVRYTPHPKT